MMTIIRKALGNQRGVGKGKPRAGLFGGIAVIEFAIVVPILALFLLSTYEIGRYVHTFFKLTQVCYEGVRAASQLTELKPICFPQWSGDPSGYDTDTPYPSKNLGFATLAEQVSGYQAHYEVQLLMNNVLSLETWPFNSSSKPIGQSSSGMQYIPNCPESIRSSSFGSIPSCAGFRPQMITQYILCDPDGLNCTCGSADFHNTFTVRLGGNYVPRLLPKLTIPLRVQCTSAILNANERFAIPQGCASYNNAATWSGGKSPAFHH